MAGRTKKVVGATRSNTSSDARALGKSGKGRVSTAKTKRPAGRAGARGANARGRSRANNPARVPSRKRA